MQYRKRPVVIEAMKYTGLNASEIIAWAHKGLPAIANSIIVRDVGGLLNVRTLEGEMMAERTNWIVKGIKGEFYPVREDIFEATYEKVEV